MCMDCENLKVHFAPTTKFVNQIVKVVAKGEQQFVACHQQLWLVGLFCHLGNKATIMWFSRL